MKTTHHHRTHLITSCTKGKNQFSPFSPVLEITKKASPESALAKWLEQIHACRDKAMLPACDLYRGSHWSTAKEIQRTTSNLEIWIISAGMGFVHSTENIVPYEATFHQLPFAHTAWWCSLTEAFRAQRKVSSITDLMRLHPTDNYVIAGSPVYIAAVELDILRGLDFIQDPYAQLTIITSNGYSGPLEPHLTKSHAGMLSELNSNMVCLNIKLAQRIIASRTY